MVYDITIVYCRVAGHTDLKTTLNSYCFKLEEKELVHNNFEKVLEEKSVPSVPMIRQNIC